MTSHQLVEIRIPYLAATIASWLLRDKTLAKYIQHQPEITVGQHFLPEALSKIQKKVGHWLLTQRIQHLPQHHSRTTTPFWIAMQQRNVVPSTKGLDGSVQRL